MATTQEIIEYYSSLLIIQYSKVVKAKGHIEAIVNQSIVDQLPLEVQNAFDPDTAIGVQLDIIGKYAGVSRSGSDFSGSPISLDDSDYRQLIKMAIIKNTGGSSLYDIKQLLFDFFPGDIFVFDLANMHMNYFILTSIGSVELVQMFVTQGLLPKPMGVELASIVFLPGIDDLFGMRTYLAPGNNVSPFNEYSSYITTWPFLSYTDTIPI